MTDDSQKDKYDARRREDTEQKETIFGNLRDGSWQLVFGILRRYLPEPHHELVVLAAIKRLKCRDLSLYILQHCSDDQLESCLETLIKQAQWESVDKLLQHFAADEWSARLEFCFKILVSLDQWPVVGDFLAIFAVSESARRWAVEEASRRADELQFERYILSHYSEDMLELVLTNFVRRGMWWIVTKILPISNPECRKALKDDGVLTTYKTLSDKEIVRYLLPSIPEDQIKLVLTVFVEQGKWKFLDSMLTRGVSESMKNWVCDEAIDRIQGILEFETLLHHFSDVHLDRLLLTLVQKGEWASVKFVFRKCTRSRARVVALLEASEKLQDSDFCGYIFPHCLEENLDEVLTTLVKRGFWESVSRLMGNNISDSQRWWAIEEASLRHDCKDFERLFLRRCSYDQMKALLPGLVERDLWAYVENVLKEGVSESQQRWVVQEALKRFDCKHFAERFLLYCDQSQLETVLPKLVEQELWDFVKKVLSRGVSTSQRRWAVEKASEKLDCQHFAERFLLYCDKSQLETVLPRLVEQELWDHVETVLITDVSTSQRRWAVEEASKRLDCQNFVELFLLHCDKSQLEALLARLVEQGCWDYVEKVLNRGVSEPQVRWAVEQAWENANDSDFFNDIWPYCSEEHMDVVLAHPKPSSIPVFLSVALKELMIVIEPHAFGELILYNIAMGNDPLGADSYSVLRSAVFNIYDPQRKVAECIKLGLSTHQPQRTDHVRDISQMSNETFWANIVQSDYSMIDLTSPFLWALLREMNVITSLLYESGSCANTELFSLYVFFREQLHTILDDLRVQPLDVHFRDYSFDSDDEENALLTSIDAIARGTKAFLPYLTEMATVPRSLMSMCRLVISHSLNIRRIRTRNVQQLPLNEKMKNYIMFSDLTSPDYSPHPSAGYLSLQLFGEEKRRVEKENFKAAVDTCCIQ